MISVEFGNSNRRKEGVEMVEEVAERPSWLMMHAGLITWSHQRAVSSMSTQLLFFLGAGV